MKATSSSILKNLKKKLGYHSVTHALFVELEKRK